MKAVLVLVVRVVAVVVVARSDARFHAFLRASSHRASSAGRRISLPLPRGWQGLASRHGARWTGSTEGHEKHMHTAKHRLRHSRRSDERAGLPHRSPIGRGHA